MDSVKTKRRVLVCFAYHLNKFELSVWWLDVYIPISSYLLDYFDAKFWKNDNKTRSFVFIANLTSSNLRFFLYVRYKYNNTVQKQQVLLLRMQKFSSLLNVAIFALTSNIFNLVNMRALRDLPHIRKRRQKLAESVAKPTHYKLTFPHINKTHFKNETAALTATLLDSENYTETTP